VLTDVAPGSRLLETEIFGPVAAILTFDDEDEVLRRANDTPWGLVGYVFTQGLDRGLRVAPFGGVKQSGLGREGGRVGIEEFLEYQYVAVPVR
jgi:succinate-semialdehyde dehydrogenase/glutarate-semialdehyde dehydrogenase